MKNVNLNLALLEFNVPMLQFIPVRGLVKKQPNDKNLQALLAKLTDRLQAAYSKVDITCMRQSTPLFLSLASNACIY